MKKAAISSLLAVSALIASPGLIAGFNTSFAQQVQLDPAEFADYDAAMNKQTTPQTQAPALEAYLAKYPKSTLKNDVQLRIMLDYAAFDHPKAIEAADKVLQVTPNNPQALYIESAYRSEAALAATDPAAKQAGLDQAANFAQRGISVPKPDAMTADQFTAFQAQVNPGFYSIIGADDLGKKDYAGAIAAYKSELAATPVAQTTAPGTALQDTYYLGQAYYQMDPKDYVSCTFYTTRAASYAPDQFKTQFQPLATYCYKKFHGGSDGYDAVVAAAKANLMPPADFKITPAPTPADQATALLASTPDADLPKLALGDKEYVIANGTAAQADKVFAPIKGKETEIPDALVISATTDSVQLALDEDNVQSKTADFSVKMKTPFKTPPAVGSKITLTATYDSYTQKPVMIVMVDGAEVSKAVKKPAPKPAPRKR